MTDGPELASLIDDVTSSHREEQPAGVIPAVWPTLVELGLADVGIPEEEGGSGGTLSNAVELMQALARYGISTPLIEANVARWVLAQAGAARRGLSTIAVTAGGVRETDGRLLASLPAVPWARFAANLVVLHEDGRSWAVELDQQTVAIEHKANVAGEPRDTVHLNGATAETLRLAPSPVLVRARLGVLWSAAICGAVARAYEMTRGYVREREQFGRPLVAIPAVASSLAMMRVHVRQTQAGLARAVECWETPATDPERCANAAAVARITAATAATDVARLAHQLHGATGVTWEYPLHRLTRRLWAWRDTETAEHEWARRLGAATIAGGEPALWDDMSA
ncbi:MAG TPA: acyl-CoA dehydrogenase family protein [Trebonia sp.]|nr:acyl-CoA dehydrogenase family protein [Trebonia sp.]